MTITRLIGYSFTSFLLLGCSHTPTSEIKRKTPYDTEGLSETISLDDENLIKKKGAANHELADADVDDKQIKQEVGAVEIDNELPLEKNVIPYSKNFLAKKNTKRMQFWVEYFTKNQRERFQRFIDNGEEYRHHIEQIFTEYGLPKELYYVGLIESGYYLGARSHAAAVGPWQFVQGTGKRYGLKITSELDERQDLFKASRAAAMYFRDLHNVFSNWELALSAYNAGENGIMRRIMKHGTRDYYELSRNKQLPSETINYVPKVLAAMYVLENAEKYGFLIPKKKNRIFDMTELRPVEKNMSLIHLSKKMGLDLDLLKRLNPELKRNATPRYFAGAYQLRVPKGKYSYSPSPEISTSLVAPARPERRIELTRRTAMSTKYHIVRPGESLLAISRRYKLPLNDIVRINGLGSWKSKIKIGQKLAISTNSNPTVKAMNRPIIYQVKPGDNLTVIAQVFNSEVAKIKQANKLKREIIMVGQKIILPDTQKGIYTVKEGDHLIKVARDLNQPLDALIKMNALKRKTIYPGQKIIVNMD
jgi:membrane-bound lytic murein transglycosylase D